MLKQVLVSVVSFLLLNFIACDNVIIVKGTWYDGESPEPIAKNDKLLIVKNGIIHSIEPVNKLQQIQKVYKDFKTLNISGKFLVPGYYDSHFHSTSTSFGEIFFPFWLKKEVNSIEILTEKVVDKYPGNESMIYAHKNRNFHREQALRSGITALTEIGGPLYSIAFYEETVNNPDSPIFYPSGNMFWVSPVPPLPDIPVVNVELKNISHAVEITTKQILMGAKNIKFYFVIPPNRKPEEYLPICRAVVITAKRFGIPVVAHPTSQTIESAVKCGVDALVHGVFDRILTQSFINLMKQHGTYYTPTFQIHEGYYQLSHKVLFERTKQDLKKMIDIRTRDRILNIPNLPDAIRKQPFVNLTIALKNLKILYDANIPILTGTDCGLPVALHGLMIHKEFEYYQQAGIRPIDILKHTTSNQAKLWNRKHGIIRIGFNADLNVLENDPSLDAKNLNSIHSTIRLGKQHKW